MPKKTQEQFEAEAHAKHDRKYTYGKYRGDGIKMDIYCPEHGPWPQTPNSHLKGHGCPHCAGVAKKDLDTFIQQARVVHGDRYDYSEFVYVNAQTPGIIICPVHGP